VLRSALFVPAHRDGWVEKALEAGPDAVILDLEDAVPPEQRDAARARVRGAIELLAASGTLATVRPNGWESGEAQPDLEACVARGLGALVLPKVDSIDQIDRFGATLSALEQARGLPQGGIALIVTLESAAGYLDAAALARARRVTGLFAAVGKGGDVQRSLGYRPTPGGLETLYIRSQAVLAARGAGLSHVLVGPWQDFRNLEGLRADAAFNRDLGFTGEVLIHPAGVEIVNEAFSPSPEEVEYHAGLIAAYEAAAAAGAGAVDYRGDHVDAAHYRTSLAFVEGARRLGLAESGREGG
jgi:citrate lyase subunit beta/citryl-CoA lyase